jgi:DltD-like protein
MPSSFISSFKGFLLRALAVQLAALAIALVASLALVKYEVEPNDRVVHSLELVQQETAADAAFGDSHFAWGFVGSAGFPTIAAEGETIADMELRVRYYYRNKQPGKVIIEGDPHEFAVYKLDRATHAYLDNMGSGFWQRFASHHRPYLGLYWQRALAGGPGAFKAKNELRYGWIVGHERWSSLDTTARLALSADRVLHHLPAGNFRDTPFADSYRRSLAFLKSRGADICVVTSPVSSDYYRYASRQPALAAVLEFVQEVAKENGARYVNFYDMWARREYDQYFRDMDHLNAVGAPLFTAKAVAACFGPVSGSFASTPK